MPRKGKFGGPHLNSIIPFTLYAQRQNIAWVKQQSPSNASRFIDAMLTFARNRAEARKLKNAVKRHLVEIARLQGLVVKLGGAYETAPAEVDEMVAINEELM